MRPTVLLANYLMTSPFYKRDGSKCLGSDWYLYLNNSRWSITFTSPFDSPNHGITNGLQSEWPWDSVWPGGAMVTGVKQVEIGGDIAYSDCTNGTFTFTNEVHNGKPVYKRDGAACRGADWYLYLNNGRWSISFDSPFEHSNHGVTSGLASEWPWDDVWPDGAIVAK